MVRSILSVLSLLCVLPTIVLARPVSYPGGWTIMQRNDVASHSLHVHYSPTARYSIGVREEYWTVDDYWLSSIAVNNLLKRWNNPESQANLYLKSGVGFAYSDSGGFEEEFEPLVYTGLSADWESRRFFVSHEIRGIEAGQIDTSFHQMGRVGIAPYIGEYGDIHTWVMVQVDHHPGSTDTLSVTPLIRLFKDVYLFEVGVSDQGKVMVNAVIRF